MAALVQDGESEFVSALNAALEGFVHRTLKEQQRECVRRIVCDSHGIRQKRHLSVDTKSVVAYGAYCR